MIILLKFLALILNSLFMNLKEHFKDIFESELISEMEHNGIVKMIKEGEILLESGQLVRQIPLILSGSIKVFRTDDDGKELLLYFIGNKESCPMTFTCCMEQHPSEITAIAEEDSEVLMIPIQMMDGWIMKYSTWKSFVMTTIRSRFNELLRTLDQIAFRKLDERLVAYLKERSASGGSSVLNVSHQEIASDLATSRVVISRLLKKLENEKRVILYRNQIKIMKVL
jgi:CRP/FNR family transcriptional regulator